MPVFDGLHLINQDILKRFKLKEGLSAETSGGLLIMIPEDKV
jgi:hypothetical protein